MSRNAIRMTPEEIAAYTKKIEKVRAGLPDSAVGACMEPQRARLYVWRARKGYYKSLEIYEAVYSAAEKAAKKAESRNAHDRLTVAQRLYAVQA
jgi:hypothetical protein